MPICGCMVHRPPIPFVSDLARGDGITHQNHGTPIRLRPVLPFLSTSPLSSPRPHALTLVLSLALCLITKYRTLPLSLVTWPLRYCISAASGISWSSRTPFPAISRSCRLWFLVCLWVRCRRSYLRFGTVRLDYRTVDKCFCSLFLVCYFVTHLELPWVGYMHNASGARWPCFQGTRSQFGSRSAVRSVVQEIQLASNLLSKSDQHLLGL